MAMEAEAPIYGIALSSADTSSQYCRLKIGHYENEKFLVLFLSSQHELIEAEVMFSGTIDCASVYPREIVKRALELNAAALIVSHNHPSNNPKPSRADIEITKKIKSACGLMDISLLDHIVVTTDSSVSLAQQGLL